MATTDHEAKSTDLWELVCRLRQSGTPVPEIRHQVLEAWEAMDPRPPREEVDRMLAHGAEPRVHLDLGPPAVTGSPVSTSPGAQPATEAMVALRLAVDDHLAQQLRWDAHGTRGGWWVWSGKVWAEDHVPVPKPLLVKIRQVVTELIQSGQVQRSDQIRLESAVGMIGIGKLLKGYGELRMHQEDLDPPYWVTTPSSLWDLRKSQPRPHDPERFSTRMTSVDPQANSPAWERILDHLRACAGDQYDSIHRLFGSCLVGLNIDRVLVWLTGPPGGGKSTLVKLLTMALGSYAGVVAGPALGRGTGRSAHDQEMRSVLAGLRLAVSHEVEGPVDWAFLKSLSGGDDHQTKRLFGRTYRFERPPLLVLVSNHPPDPPDDAAADRLVVLTMTPPEDTDEDLRRILGEPGRDQDRLLGAALQWLIDGCRAYLRQGLDPLQRYRRNPNDLERWWLEGIALGDIRPDHGWTPRANLLEHFRASAAGQASTCTDRELSAFLKSKVPKKKLEQGVVYGVALTPDAHVKPC